MKTSYVYAILIAFCGCVSNDELEISSSGTEDFKDNFALVETFDHLNKEIGSGDLSIGSGDLSIDNQIKVFYNYAISRKLEMNLNNLTCSRKIKEGSLPGVSKEHE